MQGAPALGTIRLPAVYILCQQRWHIRIWTACKNLLFVVHELVCGFIAGLLTSRRQPMSFGLPFGATVTLPNVVRSFSYSVISVRFRHLSLPGVRIRLPQPLTGYADVSQIG